MDYGALPPEINSLRMYSGAGSAPLVAAASAWSWLAAELRSAAAGYESVITRLATEEWLGTASAAMAAGAQPYVTWMQTTAAQAEQAAAHARTAAAAFESAFTATVPPEMIEVNRIQVASLMATNVLGQNTPAIAAAQAQYGEMWAQDAAVMYGYAGQSAAAAKVTPFSEPPQTTNPAGTATQAAATAQAAGNVAGTSAETTAEMITATPQTLEGLATPATPEELFQQYYAQYEYLLGEYSDFIGPLQNTFATPYRLIASMNSAASLQKAMMPAAAKAASEGAKAAAGAAEAAGLGGLLGNLGGAPVSAGLGAASPIGKLSVPPAWISSAPVVSSGAPPLPISAISAAPEAAGAGNLLGGMPLAGAGAAGGGAGPRYGFRPTVMARPPFAG